MEIQLQEIRMYYEEEGEGKPLILLHGNGEDLNVFQTLRPYLARKYKLYLLDSRGHGKSEGTDSYHYAEMAEDVREFILKKGLDKPYVFGFSDGAILALLLAKSYPDLLGRLILAGPNYSPEGLKHLGLYRFLYRLKPSSDRIRIMLYEPDLTVEDLWDINNEILILGGSRDMIRYKHLSEMRANLPSSLLKIFRGEDHSSYLRKPSKLLPYILAFFQDGQRGDTP